MSYISVNVSKELILIHVVKTRVILYIDLSVWLNYEISSFFLKIFHNVYVTNAELCLLNVANKIYTSLAESYRSLNGESMLFTRRQSLLFKLDEIFKYDGVFVKFIFLGVRCPTKFFVTRPLLQWFSCENNFYFVIDFFVCVFLSMNNTFLEDGVDNSWTEDDYIYIYIYIYTPF